MRFHFNVWAGILGSTTIGSVILDQNLNGDGYLNILTTRVLTIVEDILLNIIQEI